MANKNLRITWLGHGSFKIQTPGYGSCILRVPLFPSINTSKPGPSSTGPPMMNAKKTVRSKMMRAPLLWQVAVSVICELNISRLRINL